MKKFWLYFAVFALAFVACHKVVYTQMDSIFADTSDEFAEVTVEGEKLVFKDNTEDFSKYYVVTFTEDEDYYVEEVYMYFDNYDLFVTNFNGLFDNVVYYDTDKLMLVAYTGDGESSYDEFKEMYTEYFDTGVYSLVY